MLGPRQGALDDDRLAAREDVAAHRIGDLGRLDMHQGRQLARRYGLVVGEPSSQQVRIEIAGDCVLEQCVFDLVGVHAPVLRCIGAQDRVDRRRLSRAGNTSGDHRLTHAPARRRLVDEVVSDDVLAHPGAQWIVRKLLSGSPGTPGTRRAAVCGQGSKFGGYRVAQLIVSTHSASDAALRCRSRRAANSSEY